MWHLVPQPEIEAGPPELGAWSLTHWTTREVPRIFFLMLFEEDLGGGTHFRDLVIKAVTYWCREIDKLN